MRTPFIKSGGTLWAWGYNQDGQLGDGTNENKSIPTLIGNNFKKVVTSRGSDKQKAHSLALKTDGSLWAWGANGYYQLGNETFISSNTPIYIGDGYEDIAAGKEYSLAIKSDGTLWGWGCDECTLGRGIATYSKSNIKKPTLIGRGFKAISSSYSHSLALKKDGSLWAWGRNYYGQLGDGTTTHKYVPIFIGDDYKAISAGYDYSLAIKNDGTLWAWGRNCDAQLGDGTKTDKSTPTQIGSNFSNVSASTSHYIMTSSALKNDKSLWAWGSTMQTTIVSPTQITLSDDRDSDNLSDTWEYANFGNLYQTPQDDYDNDGVNNYDEYLEKTDPKDSNDFPLGAVLTIAPTINVGETVNSIIVYVNDKPCVTTFTDTGDGEFSVAYTLPYGTNPTADFYLKINEQYVGELNSTNINTGQTKPNLVPVYQLLLSQNYQCSQKVAY